METIDEQYKRLRPTITDGALVLFSGTGIIANIIKDNDLSEYSHIGGISECHGGRLILDSNADGVEFHRLSKRISSYKNDAKMLVIKPLNSIEEIEAEMYKVVATYDNLNANYDIVNGLKELVNRAVKNLFGIKKSLFKINLNDKKICSMVWLNYAVGLNLFVPQFYIDAPAIMFPQDYLRYLDFNKVTIIK